MLPHLHDHAMIHGGHFFPRFDSPSVVDYETNYSEDFEIEYLVSLS